jgi:hypothetical protein
MSFYKVTVLEWWWNNQLDEEEQNFYEYVVQEENEEKAKELAITLAYKEIGPTDNDLIVREVEEFEIKTDKAFNLCYEIKYYEGKDVYYSNSVQALIEYAEKLEKLVLDKGL